jgi:hypothetical protein
MDLDNETGWECPRCHLPFPIVEDVEEHQEEEHDCVWPYSKTTYMPYIDAYIEEGGWA